MGNQLQSQNKLMFYPTDSHEIYRMLGIVGRVTLSIDSREEIRNLLGENTYFKLLEDGINNFRTNFATSAYNYFLENKEYKDIEKYFNLSIGFSHNQTVTVFDPFAGEGTWLEMFKKTIPRDYINSSKVHTIANELESNRYASIVSKDTVDEVYNKAYEELKTIPKRSISMLLFNPPYGETNGVRNVLHYLKMILEDELIYKTNDNSDNGKIVMVVRKDDLLNSLPLITKHFNIAKDLMYKVNDKEYKKYKQYVVYATIKNEPLDTKSTYEAAQHEKEIKQIKELLKEERKFSVDMYDTHSMRPPAVPYEQLLENKRILEEEAIEISTTNGDGWSWIKEMTEIKEVNTEKIKKPTHLKTGEIANIIASGMIDGEMSFDGKEGFHIVAGGTKKQVQQELVQEENKKGEVENKTKTLVYSQPYLNVLVKDKNRLKIKELQGGTDLWHRISNQLVRIQ